MAPNLRGGEKVLFAPTAVQRLKEYSASQRVNSLLKDLPGVRWVRVRGANKVRGHLRFGLVAVTATARFGRWY